MRLIQDRAGRVTGVAVAGRRRLRASSPRARSCSAAAASRRTPRGARATSAGRGTTPRCAAPATTPATACAWPSTSARCRYGQWTGCHSTPIDADAPPYGDRKLTDKTNRLSYPYGVLVNARGPALLRRGRGLPVLHVREARRHHPQPARRRGLPDLRREGHAVCSRAATRPASRSSPTRWGPRRQAAARPRRVPAHARRLQRRRERGRLRSDRARRARHQGARARRSRTGRSGSTRRRSSPIPSPAASRSPSAA